MEVAKVDPCRRLFSYLVVLLLGVRYSSPCIYCVFTSVSGISSICISSDGIWNSCLENSVGCGYSFQWFLMSYSLSGYCLSWKPSKSHFVLYCQTHCLCNSCTINVSKLLIGVTGFGHFYISLQYLNRLYISLQLILYIFMIRL